MLEGVPYMAFGSLTYRPGKAVFGTWGLENLGSGATAPKVGNSPSPGRSSEKGMEHAPREVRPCGR